MRLLHINPTMNPEYGGPVSWIGTVTDAGREWGHEAEALGFADDTARWSREWKMTVNSCGPAGPLGTAPGLEAWMNRELDRFDAVILHAIWSPICWKASRLLRRRGKPHALMTHGMLDPWFNRFPMKKLKKQLVWPTQVAPMVEAADRVIFTNEEERNLARGSFRPYRPKEAVIRFGIPEPTYDPDSARRALQEAHPVLTQSRYLIYLSRLHPKKGADLAIRSMHPRHGAVPEDVLLVLAGPDDVDWKKDLLALAAEEGVQDRIVWPGMVKGDLKWGLLQEAEAFLLPSHQENFGLVIAESMAARTPLIITDKVNIHREVSAGRCGLVGTDTVESTRQSLKTFFQMSDEERREMGARGPECFLAHFHIRGSAEDFHELMQQIIR